MSLPSCEDSRNDADFDACATKTVGQACVLSDGPPGACATLRCTDEPGGELLVCVGVAPAGEPLPSTVVAAEGGDLAGGGCSMAPLGHHELRLSHGALLMLPLALLALLFVRATRRRSLTT